MILCEWGYKRIQEVSNLFFWKREKRDTKRIQGVSPWRILFGKGIRERNMNSTLLFSRFGKLENFRRLLAKEEEEEIQVGKETEKQFTLQQLNGRL